MRITIGDYRIVGTYYPPDPLNHPNYPNPEPAYFSILKIRNKATGETIDLDDCQVAELEEAALIKIGEMIEGMVP